MSTIRELADTLGAAARANKYRIVFSYPASVTGLSDIKEYDILGKSATAPQKEIGQLEYYSQGRKLVIPGDTTFDNAWSVDFYLTENHQLRLDMLKWMDACDNFQKNRHTGIPLNVMTDIKVQQLDSAGNPTATYTLHYAYPSTVGEISYADDNNDSPLEFNMVFTYTDWVSGEGEESVYVGNSATKNEIA